jgi:hypothetical protein
MEIKIQMNGHVYSLCIGHKTNWFGQISSIILSEEWYRFNKVDYARIIWKSWF